MSTPGVRGPYRNGVESRRRIIDGAIGVFAERGYGGGSLRQIADAVGAPASQIIALFGNKNGLLIAVLDHWDNQQVDDDSEHGLAYIEALRTRMQYSFEHPEWVEFFTTLSAEATAPAHPAHEYFVSRYESVTDRLQAEIEAASRAEEIGAVTGAEARHEARRLSAMMDGLQLQWLLNRTFDVVGVFDDYLDAVIARWTASKHETHATTGQ